MTPGESNILHVALLARAFFHVCHGGWSVSVTVTVLLQEGMSSGGSAILRTGTKPEVIQAQTLTCLTACLRYQNLPTSSAWAKSEEGKLRGKKQGVRIRVDFS